MCKIFSMQFNRNAVSQNRDHLSSLDNFKFVSLKIHQRWVNSFLARCSLTSPLTYDHKITGICLYSKLVTETLQRGIKYSVNYRQ